MHLGKEHIAQTARLCQGTLSRFILYLLTFNHMIASKVHVYAVNMHVR